MLDFTVLRDYEKPVAVCCPTEADAEAFVSEMEIQYPHLMHPWVNEGTHWNVYKEYTCYAPHIYDKRARNMEYSPDHYWRSVGYEIVPFERLAHCLDLCEFEAPGSIEIDLLGL